jgi:predicted RNase H-like nuclease
MKFIGIDLGWSSGASGLCCLSWQNNQLELIECDRQQSLNDILTWIDTQVSPTEPAIIAVDAPTIIANLTGMREADKLTHKHFGRYHAGCYPANLSRPFAQKTVEFGLCLEARGFVHAPIMETQKLGRYQIEVYPHPATINLFRLDRIIKYKKGKLAERQLELMKLCQYIVDILPSLEPALNLSFGTGILPVSCGTGKMPVSSSNLPEIPTSIATLKALEDKLDALLCAYIGAHWWYWGRERNLVLGDRTTGYIVIPQGR